MRYGLIGEHLGHSYSREIHALIADYKYELAELKPEELGGFLRKREFNAINVTIPYKQAVIPYLDGISENAASIGAVNTIVNRNGRLFGYNTDLAGMLALAKRIGIDAKGKKLLILGSGGTSKTARAAAKILGAGEIITVSRSGKNGDVSYEEVAEKHADARIVFNTTPVGMFPYTDGQAIDLAPFKKCEAVLDVVYNPLRTDLVLDAQARGMAADGGLYMLTAQAVYASALFLGREADASDIEKTFLRVYNDKRNLVLTGMPSSGKTTVGKLLAEKTGRAFFDSDDIIVEKLGMPIADFFEKSGEAAFRTAESEVIAELSKKSGCVIATGGGAVLNDGNVRRLRHNGTLYFLDRSPEKLMATADRPLSSDREALMRRYNERYGIYTSTADVIINADGAVTDTAEQIKAKSGKRKVKNML
ncbi:MAG: shikimate kinase [Eubacteriales bacterium]|nr:shikimate kinase [Eubacteriales bacterium]